MKKQLRKIKGKEFTNEILAGKRDFNEISLNDGLSMEDILKINGYLKAQDVYNHPLTINHSEFNRVNFGGIYLPHTLGIGVYFHDTNFNNALLWNVNFEGANFDKVTFRGSDFTHADFKKANFSDLRANNIGCNFRYADFSDAHFSKEIDLYGSNFSGATLESTIFKCHWLDIRCVDFNGIRGNNLEFYGENVSWVCLSKFINAELKNAYFKNVDMQEVNFSGADLCNALFCRSDLRDAKLNKCNIAGADFSGADFSGADFRDIKGLERVYGLETAKFEKTIVTDKEKRVLDGILVSEFYNIKKDKNGK